MIKKSPQYFIEFKYTMKKVYINIYIYIFIQEKVYRHKVYIFHRTLQQQSNAFNLYLFWINPQKLIIIIQLKFIKYTRRSIVEIV